MSFILFPEKQDIQNQQSFLQKPVPVAMNIHDLYAFIFFQVFPEPGNENIHAPAGEVWIFAPNFQKRFFADKELIFREA